MARGNARVESKLCRLGSVRRRRTTASITVSRYFASTPTSPVCNNAWKNEATGAISQTPPRRAGLDRIKERGVSF